MDHRGLNVGGASSEGGSQNGGLTFLGQDTYQVVSTYNVFCMYAPLILQMLKDNGHYDETDPIHV